MYPSSHSASARLQRQEARGRSRSRTPPLWCRSSASSSAPCLGYRDARVAYELRWRLPGLMAPGTRSSPQELSSTRVRRPLADWRGHEVLVLRVRSGRRRQRGRGAPRRESQGGSGRSREDRIRDRRRDGCRRHRRGAARKDPVGAWLLARQDGWRGSPMREDHGCPGRRAIKLPAGTTGWNPPPSPLSCAWSRRTAAVRWDSAPAAPLTPPSSRKSPLRLATLGRSAKRHVPTRRLTWLTTSALNGGDEQRPERPRAPEAEQRPTPLHSPASS